MNTSQHDLELEKLRAETAKLSREVLRLDGEIEKLKLEAAKIHAETIKIERETWWYPVAITATGVTAFIGMAVFVMKLFLP